MPRLIYLFDIDGTLVDAQGMGGKAFRSAVREVLKYELDWQSRDFAGQTDAGLFDRVLKQTASPKDLLPELYRCYHQHLARNLREKSARILPGVIPLLERLFQAEDVELGLLTGNTQQGGLLKLGKLSHFFSLGYHGEIFTERVAIGRYARDDLERKLGREFELIIVGDTPNDIACARAAGAYSVAVATGLYSVDELSSADFVLRDFTEWSL